MGVLLIGYETVTGGEELSNWIFAEEMENPKCVAIGEKWNDLRKEVVIQFPSDSHQTCIM